MNRNKITTLFIVGALVVVAALGVITYNTVSAQATTPTPGGTTPSQDGKALSGKIHGGPGGSTDEDLAAALGIDVARLQEAYQEATTEALAQAVSKGLITQEQADRFAERASGRFPMHKAWLGEGEIDFDALLADALGISVDDLAAAKDEAFNASIDRAVTDGLMTQEQADLMKGRRALGSDTKFQASMQSAFEAAVQQAVTDGVITQAQADQILSENNGKPFFGRGGFDGMRGGRHGGPGGRLPGGQTAPDTQTPDTTPSDGA